MNELERAEEMHGGQGELFRKWLVKHTPKSTDVAGQGTKQSCFHCCLGAALNFCPATVG